MSDDGQAGKTGILSGLRVIEVSAFVAAPLGGATLAALGADVVRIDPPGGGIDANRWPRWEGRSLYWAGLNQGKRSLTIDTKNAAGRDLVRRLITASGEGGGILLTNLPAAGWISYEDLAALRSDVIVVSIVGSSDGSTAVDYTVNAGIGFPWVTGPEGIDDPVNHVLPAWDLLTGGYACTALLAAERRRRLEGRGQLVRVALADVALAISGHLGLLAEARLAPMPRPRVGNHLYGSFAHDFRTNDGRRLIIVALTRRQWRSLVKATGIGSVMAALEADTGFDLGDEAARYQAREAIVAAIRPWVGTLTLAEAGEILDQHDVLWGPYRTFQQLVAEDPRASADAPLFDLVDQPGLGAILTARSPIVFGGSTNLGARRAPELGEHSDQVLREVLDLPATEIERLRAAGVVGPRPRVVDRVRE